MSNLYLAQAGSEHLRVANGWNAALVVAADVAQQIAVGDRRITGIMVESHLNEGRQDILPGTALRHGVSVTDACISMAQTIPLLLQLATAVRSRRGL